MEFLDLLSADHHAIDDEVYRELGKVFTAAQIIELGFTCANTMGLHRFIHTLDVFGTSPPVIAYDPEPGRHRRADVPGSAGMSETVFVTGATGLAGANVCRLLVERGDHVRALARASRPTPRRWPHSGSRSCTGDITDADDVRRAATGHRRRHPLCRAPGWGQPAPARLRGGERPRHPARSRRRRGARSAPGGRREHRDLLRHLRGPRPRGRPRHRRSRARTPTRSPRWRPSRTPWPAPRPVRTSSPPTRAPSSVPPGREQRARQTSFNRVLVSALRERITRYLRFPVSWVFADDVARGCILALDRGVSGERYMLDGRPEES